MEIDGKKFVKIEGQTEIDVVPIPELRQPEYFFKLPDGQHIYVSADGNNYEYESFKLCYLLY